MILQSLIMMQSSNPTLRESTFRNAGPITAGATMTVNGTAVKTGILTALVLASATWIWNEISSGGQPAWFGSAVTFGWIIPLATGLIVSFIPRTAPWLAPVYAVGEGLLLGLISWMFESKFHGLVLTSVLLTCGVLVAMLAAYMTGVIRATEKFKMGVFAATGGIAIFYLVNMVLGMFGIQIPGLFGNGMIGIGFSVFVVVIAALNLVMDFDMIEQGAAQGAPKYMEWYGAFALLVTLVWLYIEILRLLSKLRSRD
ncbi:MAG: rane protein [Verrucomicrobiaceae bacterium]|nr:rane protein [Verrucomicrobiaceae bacterium]